MNDYESWSFRDRAFGLALGISLLWHAFWFFSISIVVNPSKMKHKPRPLIVSLGPVLDDSIFRTLAQTKPQLSETFYRRLSDFAAPMELEVQTAERYQPGDVVSVPMGKKVTSLLRTLMGGEKTSPDYEFASKIKLGYSEESYTVEGDAAGRVVASKPSEPRIPTGVSVGNPEMELYFTVDPAGVILKAEILVSSGDALVDTLWLNYFKEWQFDPADLGKPQTDQAGKIKFRLSVGLKEES